MITLNFQSMGITLGGRGATVTRLVVDVGVRADDVVVTLGEDSEPSDVVPVDMVTPLSADVRSAVPALWAVGDDFREERGRICRLMRLSGSAVEEGAGVDLFVFPNGVSLLGEKNDVRVLVADFPFLDGVVVAGGAGVIVEVSVSMLSSLMRRDLRMELGSISSDFLVLLELVDMSVTRCISAGESRR